MTKEDHIPDPEACVYVANFRATLDLSDARRFTKYDFIYLTEEVVRLSNTEALTNHLLKELEDFRPVDYLLVSGPAIISMIATAILLKTFKLPYINILIFNGFEQTYYTRRLGVPA